MTYPVAILNSSVLTAGGKYDYDPITLAQARRLVKGSIESYIGHESTAQILTELLGRPIPMNRGRFVQQRGQRALVFKLNDRPPEGKILSRAEIEEIGYELMLMTRTK